MNSIMLMLLTSNPGMIIGMSSQGSHTHLHMYINGSSSAGSLQLSTAC
jgi:hypothetical protein